MGRRMENLVNSVVQLIPVTLKGKNRVREIHKIENKFSNFWKIIKFNVDVQFSCEKNWILCIPEIECDNKDKYSRWIHIPKDNDFIIYFN